MHVGRCIYTYLHKKRMRDWSSRFFWEQISILRIINFASSVTTEFDFGAKSPFICGVLRKGFESSQTAQSRYFRLRLLFQKQTGHRSHVHRRQAEVAFLLTCHRLPCSWPPVDSPCEGSAPIRLAGTKGRNATHPSGKADLGIISPVVSAELTGNRTGSRRGVWQLTDSIEGRHHALGVARVYLSVPMVHFLLFLPLSQIWNIIILK